MIAAAVAATLCADLGWYGLGRWRGTSVLTGLGRLSPKADALVRHGQAAFCSHRAMFRMSARMLPEMNPVAAGLAGATGQGLASFLGYGMASAMIWVGVWIGLGYLLGDALMEFAARYAIRLPEFLIAA